MGLFTEYTAGCFVLRLYLCQAEDNQRQQDYNPNQEFFFSYQPKDDREVPVDFVTGYNIRQHSQKDKLCSKGFYAASIQCLLGAL